MRTFIVIALGLAICAPLAHAHDKPKIPKPQKLTVWVSDEKCGVKGANASHAALCADAFAFLVSNKRSQQM